MTPRERIRRLLNGKPLDRIPNGLGGCETVKANVTALNRNGGYIFAGVHNLPGDMPETHVDAMLHAYRDCRDDGAMDGQQRTD